MEDAILAEQLREWAVLLEAGRVSGVVAGLRFVAKSLEPKARLCERIVVTRYWFEDQKYVEARKADNPIEGWMRQLRSEFDEAASSAGAVAYKGEGHSVIEWLSSNVKIETHTDGNMTATFDVVLDFLHQPDERIPADDPASVIQHLFYDEGGVAGNFHINPPSGEE